MPLTRVGLALTPLLIIALAAATFISCNQPTSMPDTPAATTWPTPVVHTPEPPPTASAQAPVAQTPVPSVVGDGSGTSEYAVACGELLAASPKTTGEQGERDFVEWVRSLDALTPPPELRGFHDAWTTQFSAQLLTGGPNGETQEAYDLEIRIVAEMSPSLRQVLVDASCLSEIDILTGGRRLEAEARMTRGGSGTPPPLRGTPNGAEM